MPEAPPLNPLPKGTCAAEVPDAAEPLTFIGEVAAGVGPICGAAGKFVRNVKLPTRSDDAETVAVAGDGDRIDEMSAAPDIPVAEPGITVDRMWPDAWGTSVRRPSIMWIHGTPLGCGTSCAVEMRGAPLQTSLPEIGP
jgi:hypothetical protein